MLVNLREISGIHIYLRGWHQPYVLRPILQFLRPGMTMIDVGAHFGQFSVAAGLAVGSEGAVHAFEPGRDQLRYLQHNVEINKLKAIVQINRTALGSSPGTIGYKSGAEGNLGGSHVVPDGTDVALTTLDRYCADRGVPKVDALKIDVEGYELEVLRGFARTLRENPPGLIAYECDVKTTSRYDYEPQDLHSILLDAGYSIRKARGGGAIDRKNMARPQWQNDFIARLN
jgi:FkbM family methyltransferase